MAAQHRPHLYILTSDDIPFVHDGWRDGEHFRAWMTTRFREVLAGCSVAWGEVRGSRQERLGQVVEHLTEHSWRDLGIRNQ
jgi:HTH-type transcriptional regulator, transcriptional repressor of NAD biosynthesis genes